MCHYCMTSDCFQIFFLKVGNAFEGPAVKNGEILLKQSFYLSNVMFAILSMVVLDMNCGFLFHCSGCILCKL